MKQKRYLDKKPLEEAQRLFLSRLRPFIETFQEHRIERVRVVEALHRVTAEAVFATMSCPHYPAAAMDGFAVPAGLTHGATEFHPVRLRVGREAHPVDTGAPLPEGTNAVIKIEDVRLVENETIEVEQGVYPYQNVRALGEDIVAGEMILPENHRINPYDMGALLAGGLWEIDVRSRPRITVIPTGSELVEPGRLLRRGNILDFNSTVLKGLISEDGGEFSQGPVTKDDGQALRRAILQAIETSDVTVVIAGSSAGSKDFTCEILEDLGEVLVHGVSIMPGKPTILGLVRNKPVVGVPGYPVSAVIAYEQFVRPLTATLLGSPGVTRRRVRAVPAASIPSKLGVEEFLRVKLGRVGTSLVATPLPRGASLVTSLSKADGIIRIPRLSEGLTEGQEVTVELLRAEEEIENRIMMVGSHDMTLDLLASRLRRESPPFDLSSIHVGSMGGLLAVQRGRAHVAGIHLFDPETGRYNVPHVQRILRGMKVWLVHLVARQQGLLVARGNPKNIRGVEDLSRDGIVFVNRQHGSGTRLLLDHLLKQHRVAPEKIRGYEREESTHMAVAAAVLSGGADAGIGIYSAARTLGLSFVPLTMEKYDLVIPDVFFPDERIQALLGVIRSEAFQRSIQELGGYDISDTGELVSLG